MLNEAAKSLQLDGVLGVSNPMDVERVIIGGDFLAGIMFDHEEVKHLKN